MADPSASEPFAVAVNPVTNKTYAANGSSNNVTVIDGATNSTTTVAAGVGPDGLAVNPVSNKIYVANAGSGNVTVIDAATKSSTTVSARRRSWRPHNQTSDEALALLPGLRPERILLARPDQGPPPRILR